MKNILGHTAFCVLILAAATAGAQPFYPQNVRVTERRHSDELLRRCFVPAPTQAVEWTVQVANWQQQLVQVQKSSSGGKENIMIPATRAHSIMALDSANVAILGCARDSLAVYEISSDLKIKAFPLAEIRDGTLDEVLGMGKDSSGAYFYLRHRDSLFLVAHEKDKWTINRVLYFQRSSFVYRVWRCGAYQIFVRQLGTSSNSGTQTAMVEVVTNDNTILARHYVPAYSANITVQATKLYYLYAENQQYKLGILQDYASLYSRPQDVCVLESPSAGLYEPLAIIPHDDTLHCLFRNGMVRVVGENTISADNIELYDFDRNEVYLAALNGWVYVWNSSAVLDIHITEDHIWFVRSVVNDIARYGGLTLLCVLLIFIALRGLRYRRQLRDVVEADAAAVAFVVDRNMKLRRINQLGRDLFEMDTTTPLRRVLKYYCNGEIQKIVESFVSSAFSTRTPQSQKLTLRSASVEKEIIFTAQPLRSLTGGFDGVVIHGIDITAELERKRLVNWAQLAHDMQTNLSIIKLNTEQLASAVKPEYEDRRKRILFQTGLLLQRVRDIVSIGRDEQLHLAETDIRDIFREVANEFDDASFAHVKMVIQEQACIVRLDKAKMLRALRNAVENSIRALRGEQGTIQMNARRDAGYLVISVADTGIGMDEATRENFLKPYFSNYRQYGGTGIGTMIMLRAIEIHKGSIEVQSELGKGTTISFKLPGSLYVRS